MRNVYCTVQHNPPHSYGDCVRACVASIMHRDSEDVPHFYERGGTGSDAGDRAALADWMLTQGYAPFFVGYDGDAGRYEILTLMGEQNPTSLYVLFGRTGDGFDHAVVCRGDRIIHNPCAGQDIVMCGSAGIWVVMGICVAR